MRSAMDIVARREDREAAARREVRKTRGPLPPRRSTCRAGGLREKSIDNLIAAIEGSKSPRLERFLFALGIEHVGETVPRGCSPITSARSTARERDGGRPPEIHGIGPKSPSPPGTSSRARGTARCSSGRQGVAGVRLAAAEARPSGPRPPDGEDWRCSLAASSSRPDNAQRFAERNGAKIAGGASARR